MSSVFDDVVAIAKAQSDAYHTAYQEGYTQGFRDATAQAKAIIERAFPHFEKQSEKTFKPGATTIVGPEVKR